MKHSGGVIFVLAGVTGYALLPIWVKNILPSGLNPLDIATWRFVFAAPMMWLILLGMGTPAPRHPIATEGVTWAGGSAGWGGTGRVFRS